MLRSEVPWFPRFIQICNNYFMDWMEEKDMDYQAMKHVLQCQCQRKVWSLLNAYNETAFRELIQTQRELAQKAVAREKKCRLTKPWAMLLQPVWVEPLPWFSMIHDSIWSTTNTSSAHAWMGVGTALPWGKNPVQQTSIIGVGASPLTTQGMATSYGGDSSMNQPEIWQLEMLLNDARASGRPIASITHTLNHEV